jgi:hypothetical protein
MFSFWPWQFPRVQGSPHYPNYHQKFSSDFHSPAFPPILSLPAYLGLSEKEELGLRWITGLKQDESSLARLAPRDADITGVLWWQLGSILGKTNLPTPKKVCAEELSAMTDMFSSGDDQYGSHLPHVAIIPLKCDTWRRSWILHWISF